MRVHTRPAAASLSMLSVYSSHDSYASRTTSRSAGVGSGGDISFSF